MHVYWHTNKTIAEKKKSKKKLKLVSTTSVEKVYDIIDYVTQIEWSGADTEVSRTMVISFLNDPYGDNDAPELKGGDKISLYGDSNDRLFFGRVTGKERNGEKGTESYTCQDYMNSMLRSNISVKYKNKTADSITKDACKRIGISVGKLVKPGVKVKIYATEAPVYNICLKSYKLSSKKTSIQYFPYMDGTKFCVKEKGQIVGRGYNSRTQKVEESFLLSQDSNIVSSHYTEDTGDMINKVAITNSKGKRIGTITNAGWAKTYGIYQAMLSVDKGNGKKEAKAMLKGLARANTLECVGDERCISGAGIKVFDKVTKITGVFWISADSHSWENGKHMMSLTLRFKNITENPEVNYDSNSKKKSTSSKVLNGRKKAGLKFEAYSIGDSGTKDSHGRLLKNGEGTVACDFLSYGKKIQIFGTGTRYDGKVMTVRDADAGNRHSIKILMTKADKKSWKNRIGYVIVSNGTGYKLTSEDDSAKAQKIVAEAKKWVGKVKYLYGANNIPGGRSDCSAFTHFVFKKSIGREIGRTTTQQITHGKAIKKWSQLRAGDLIFFSIKGEGINSHVGICIGGGKLIHCGCTYGVHIERMSNSYYRSQFYQGRRLV